MLKFRKKPVVIAEMRYDDSPEATNDPREIRASALGTALMFYATKDVSPEKVVTAAKVFATYVLGDPLKVAVPENPDDPDSSYVGRYADGE